MRARPFARLASAAAVNTPGTFVLDDALFWNAAVAVTDVCAAITREAPAADTVVRIASVPAHQVEALQRVGDAVQRAVDRDDDAERLLELLRLVLDHRDLTLVGLVGDLDRVLAVLALDTPAVWTIARAYFTDDRGTAWQTACQEVTAAWRAAGITP